MDKVAVITGAAHRIGRRTAEVLHAAGFRVMIHFNTREAQASELMESFNRARPDSADTFQGDLTAADTIAGLLEKTERRWGRLDVLVNNASIYHPTPADEPDLSTFDALFTTNLRAPYHLSTSAVPLLRASEGCIVNLTDVYALRPQAGHAVYCASKAGLIGLTKALALDLAPQIRVNGVSPGAIIWAESDAPDYRREVMEKTPLKRSGEAGDIAAAIKYLATAPFVTGQILEVDGGRSIFI